MRAARKHTHAGRSIKSFRNWMGRFPCIYYLREWRKIDFSHKGKPSPWFREGKRRKMILGGQSTLSIIAGNFSGPVFFGRQ